MEYTVTINIFHALWMLAFVVVFYIYTKDDGDDRLTQIRHDVEMRKEWFRMLAEKNKRKRA
jgi:hypothetical protein